MKTTLILRLDHISTRLGSHPFHDKLLDAAGPGSPRSITKSGHLDQGNKNLHRKQDTTIPLNTVEEIHTAMSLLDGNLEEGVYKTTNPSARRRGKARTQLSKLNCCKVRERTDAAIAEADASYTLTSKMKCCKVEDESLGRFVLPPRRQELQWSAFDDQQHLHPPSPSSSSPSSTPQWRSFDIRPIAEDHSVTGQSIGHSVTAPLLARRSPGLHLGEF